jgi:FAD/FMN-containing dehydrogenase
MVTKTKPARRITWYAVLIISLLVAVLLFRPVWHLLRTGGRGGDILPKVPKGYADDVSRLNQTHMDSLVQLSPHPDSAISQLRGLLRYARQKHLPVSIAGAKHSMGGHTIAPDGVRIDMLPFKKLSLDTTTGILTAGAGALWSEVIPYLNRYSRAVWVMQSDNAFSVGGSVSVNCHGWQHNTPPIASTVVSFRILTADGQLLQCSRQENQELFSLALGGYGLFGVILEVDLQTVSNEIYRYHRLQIPSGEYLDYYRRYVDENPKVRMVFGRLNVNKEDFLEYATLNYFQYEEPAGKNHPLPNPGLAELKRTIFEGTKGDDYGKKLRWDMETLVAKARLGSTHSRNQIMNESPAFFLNQNPNRTDILHEYFIPRRNFNSFIQALQRIVPQYQADLLNVTIRNVYKDEDTFLNYAREEVFAFVLFFNQPITAEAEADMTGLTQELIAAAHASNGVYYLPYRLHASVDQMKQAYPMSEKFFHMKLAYDPDEVFQNKFYQQYRTLQQ